MAIQGNAFALLDDDAETLLARLSTAAVEPDKRNPKNNKHSSSLSQSSTAAPQRSSTHEKGRPFNKNGGFERQTKTNGNAYNNRDGVERQNRNRVESNGGQENGGGVRQSSRGKPNNAYRHDERQATDGLKRNNGHFYQKKQETTNDDSEKTEDTDNDGWQVVRRSKQNIVEGNVGGRQRNYVGRRDSNNGNEAKQHQDESGEKVVVSDGILNDNRTRNGGNGRANRGGYSRATNRSVSYQRPNPAEGEENEKPAELTTELDNEKEVHTGIDDVNAGPEGDESASKVSSNEKKDKGPSQSEIERMKERELEAKRITLKEYEEKKLEEKRKALGELLKTEERKVALDKELESMHIIGRKKEETNSDKQHNSVNDKLKKKVVNNKGDSNAPKVKSQLFRHPTSGRGRNGRSEGAVVIPVGVIPPPSFQDAKQFPALA